MTSILILMLVIVVGGVCWVDHLFQHERAAAAIGVTLAIVGLLVAFVLVMFGA